jgi:hypothetical protein
VQEEPSKFAPTAINWGQITFYQDEEGSNRLEFLYRQGGINQSIVVAFQFECGVIISEQLLRFGVLYSGRDRGDKPFILSVSEPSRT